MAVRPVVVGVDGSASAYRAVEWAAAEAHRRGAGLRLVRAFSWTTADRPTAWVARYRDEMLDVSRRQVARAVALAADTRADVETEPHVEIGAPIEVLSSEARRAQLCGRRPRSTRSWRRSSSGTRPRRAPVSHGVLHGAHCPVAVVRPGTDG